VEDEIHDLLDEARHSDGIVIGSPIYFFDISAQTKCFLERLNYPGPTEKPVPSNENFRRNAKARWERREEQFPRDLENAYHAGEKMVKTFKAWDNQ
jgi:hypothetical protein